MRDIVVATISAAYREGLDAVARAYERRHPDTRVRVEVLPANGYETWLRTQINGDRKTGPDLFNANYGWGLFEKGLLTNFGPLVGRVNPYTGKPWRQTLSAPFLEKAKVGGDISYIPLDSIEIAFYYNAAHFARLDLAPPRTWEEMLAHGRALQKAGHIPFAVPANADSYWAGAVGWLARFFSDAYTRHRVAELASRPGDWDYDPRRNAGFKLDLRDPYNDSLLILNGERTLEAVRSGRIRFDDERFGEMYARIREFSRLWQPGFHGTATQAAYHLFLTGHASIYLDTSAAIGQILKDMDDLPTRARFPWGVFPIPPMTTSRFHIPAFRGVGGAGAVFAIVKKDDAQTAAAVDFLMFLTTPESAKTLVDQAVKHRRPLTGPMLIPGAPIPEEMRRYFRAFENRGFEKLSFRGLSDEQQSVWEWTVWAQRYMEGRIDLKGFLARYQKLMTEAVPRVIAMQHLDMNPRTKDTKS